MRWSAWWQCWPCFRLQALITPQRLTVPPGRHCVGKNDEPGLDHLRPWVVPLWKNIGKIKLQQGWSYTGLMFSVALVPYFAVVAELLI